jgi:hypothetical protein
MTGRYVDVVDQPPMVVAYRILFENVAVVTSVVLPPPPLVSSHVSGINDWELAIPARNQIAATPCQRPQASIRQ